MSVARMVQLAPPAPPLEVLDRPGQIAAPPLVLLHEGLGSVGLWRDFPDQLQASTGRRVIAFSRSGHGASPPPPRPRDAGFHHEEAHEVLPALLAHCHVREPVLIGHSDGASIALLYAARHPVTALVLLAPHVFVEEVTVRAIQDTRREYLQGDLRARMARRHADPDACFRGWCEVWLDPAFRDWNIEDQLGRVHAPVLLVQGAEDPYGTLEQLRRIEAGLPRRSQCEVVNGGHSPHREHGEWLAARIARFLSEPAPPERRRT